MSADRPDHSQRLVVAALELIFLAAAPIGPSSIEPWQLGSMDLAKVVYVSLGSWRGIYVLRVARARSATVHSARFYSATTSTNQRRKP
jgi:hypothetical protein